MEIGGYIELERNRGDMLHKKAIALNCGRRCLSYLIEARKIKKIYLPKFSCGAVVEPCKKAYVEIQFYNIDTEFHPVFNSIKDDGWLYLTNYYGQLDNDYIRSVLKYYPKCIVDNAQAYYQRPIEGTDTLYTCRKYFGVSDGAFLYTNQKLDKKLEQDESWNHMKFLLGRFERTASEFYQEYSDNNARFDNEPIRIMSKLTDNLLHGIDYKYVKDRRTHNFSFFHKKLRCINKLKLMVPEGAFMYPLLIEGGYEMRKKLQAEKIYIPTLWPDVFDVCKPTELEYDLARNILPLPVDQRYQETDLEVISDLILKLLEENNEF